MPFYETVFIARQDISTTQAEALTEQFSGIITENGGQVLKKEPWGLRNIAYRINKNRKGHYTLLNIDAPSAAVQEMERQMRISEDVLRYLTVRVEALEEGPSAMLRARAEGEREGRRGGFREGGGFGGGFRDREGGGGYRGDREGGGYRGDREDRPRRDAVVAPVEAREGEAS